MNITKSIKNALLVGVGMATVISCANDEIVPLRDPNTSGTTTVNYTYAATADSMQVATYNTYLSANNTFAQDNAGNTSFNYWPNAHALDMLVDGYLRTKDQSYVGKMKALHDGIKVKNGGTYNNVFNDDMLWLANSCMRAYAATNDNDYKNTALYLMDIISKSWTSVMGGGITWKQDTPYEKNAVSNAPAAILAMRLYETETNKEAKQKYLTAAKAIYDWQKSKIVEASTGLVWDGVKLVDGKEVVNQSIYTYNMGTWIGAALRLYHATGDAVYLQDAVRSGKAIIASGKLTSNGLLRDEGQGDGGLFKGICVRYFTELIEEKDITDADRKDFVKFLQFNAQTFYSSGIKRPEMLSGSNWGVKPTGNTDLTTQLSGLMLIEAAAKLKSENIFQ